MSLPLSHPMVDGRTSHSALVRAARGDRPEKTPVWFMRQAGRSLPEYRETRAGTRMLDACLDPALASEITLQPVRRHGVDAAVFFSDIVIPVLLAGVEVEIVPGRGPVFAHPIRTAEDVAQLPTLDNASLAPISDAVARTVAELGDKPLIAFAGAPFTVASYMIEGGPSKDQLRARALMHSDPETWARLMEWCADIAAEFLRAQILAGASLFQVFDSWAGSLSTADYRTHVAPFTRLVFERVSDLDVPSIHFGLGLADSFDTQMSLGSNAIGVDWRTPLSALAPYGVPLQGNIDPALLTAPWSVLEAHVRDVLAQGREAKAHIVNLGHGVPPETDPDVLGRIVDLVHAEPL